MLAIICSDNGLSPVLRQAIIWTNAGVLLDRPRGIKFGEIVLEIPIFSVKRINVFEIVVSLRHDDHFDSAPVFEYDLAHCNHSRVGKLVAGGWCLFGPCVVYSLWLCIILLKNIFMLQTLMWHRVQCSYYGNSVMQTDKCKFVSCCVIFDQKMNLLLNLLAWQ